MYGRLPWVRLLGGAMAAAALLATGVQGIGAEPPPDGPRPYRIMPAEFEPQDAVLLGWDRKSRPVQRTLLEIVGAIRRRVQVVMLVRSDEDRASVLAALPTIGLPPTAVRFLPMSYDTIWARDYGPAVVWTNDGQLQIVDAAYERGERPRDDDVPTRLAPQLLLPTVRTPLAIEGGNLLTNGVGLCVTSWSVLRQNAARGYREEDVARLVRDSFGVREVVFLEPLAGEPTGHVDMFCTFTSADTILVGRISPQLDPENAAILDRNAERLAGLWTPRGPLRVVRIPMPPRADTIWRTYTNVLYANGVVVVPTYAGVDPELEAAALAVFRRVLPDWQVVGIDCTSLISLGGAAHCVSMNLSRIGRLPTERRPDGWQRSGTSAGTRPPAPTEPATPFLTPRRAPAPGMFAPDQPTGGGGVTPFRRD